MIPWLNTNFKNFKPTAAIALNATRHMKRVERKKLFSPDIEPMRTAEGRWFEAIVYEMFLEISQKYTHIKYLARKGADAPHTRDKAQLGQNGIFYSNPEISRSAETARTWLSLTCCSWILRTGSHLGKLSPPRRT